MDLQLLKLVCSTVLITSSTKGSPLLYLTALSVPNGWNVNPYVGATFTLDIDNVDVEPAKSPGWSLNPSQRESNEFSSNQNWREAPSADWGFTPFRGWSASNKERQIEKKTEEVVQGENEEPSADASGVQWKSVNKVPSEEEREKARIEGLRNHKKQLDVVRGCMFGLRAGSKDRPCKAFGGIILKAPIPGQRPPWTL